MWAERFSIAGLGEACHHVFAAAPVNIFHIVFEKLGIMVYKIAEPVIEKKQPVNLSVQIPCLARADVIRKRPGICAGKDPDVFDPAVYDVRKHEIDNAVSAPDGNGCDRPVRREASDIVFVFVQIDDRHVVLYHFKTSLPHSGLGRNRLPGVNHCDFSAVSNRVMRFHPHVLQQNALADDHIIVHNGIFHNNRVLDPGIFPHLHAGKNNGITEST